MLKLDQPNTKRL